MLHPFTTLISHLTLPRKFTYPFCYTPHPLCLRAAYEVQEYLKQQKQWKSELDAGKMFGVLVVRTPDDRLGYLAAFSGTLAGTNVHPFFVPPVYDMLQPDGFFLQEEKQIEEMNAQIDAMANDPKYLEMKATLTRKERATAAVLDDAKNAMREARLLRDKRRKEAVMSPKGKLSAKEEAEMIRESQFQRAEYKRLEKKLTAPLEALREEIDQMEDRIFRLRWKRKHLSAGLQQRLFKKFELLNAKGEVKNVFDIFKEIQKFPPAGSGECAAPKLLQQAYLHGWQPIAMAEFWWGQSPKTEIRRQGNFYPACQGKCGPILAHMLVGLDVEDNPMQGLQTAMQPLSIVYEDEWMVVVDKPAGMLSVPGKEKGCVSVYSIMRQRYPDAEEPMIVHRLDMATSGLMIVCKAKRAHQALQKQFEEHLVRKRYVALLDGNVRNLKGRIELPLCPDPHDRPRQLVHALYGKEAITEYEVLSKRNNRTLVAFYPLTGRTHQLRVHAAHPLGLDCPIVGDELYGHKGQRLCLHAESLEFTHPVTGKKMHIRRKAEFTQEYNSAPTDNLDTSDL